MWENTVTIFVSDNGGPLDHCTNSPLRGGKHTFLEGGVRVMSFISGPLIPPARRGTRWTGMAASADWYKIIVEGIAEGQVPSPSGTRPPDALNLWYSTAIICIANGHFVPTNIFMHFHLTNAPIRGSFPILLSFAIELSK